MVRRNSIREVHVMAVLEWKYVSVLKDDRQIDGLERKYQFKLPDDLKQCMTKYNAGVPNLVTYDIGGNTAMVFGGLLSLNPEDPDSVFDYAGLFEKDNGCGVRMFPFAIDPAGNLFCIENNRVVLYCHEDDKVIRLSDSFSALLDMLY